MMSDRYHVDWSAVKHHIRKLQSLAGAYQPERTRLAHALAHLADKLSEDPLEFGEPKYTLTNKPIVMCVGFNRRFQIDFGVYEAARQVYVQRFKDLEAKD